MLHLAHHGFRDGAYQTQLLLRLGDLALDSSLIFSRWLLRIFPGRLEFRLQSGNLIKKQLSLYIPARYRAFNAHANESFVVVLTRATSSAVILSEAKNLSSGSDSSLRSE
jgi:hypothetical protein